MGHTFNIKCEQCSNVFCQCHDYFYSDLVDGDRYCFCSEECKEEYAKESLELVEYSIKEKRKVCLRFLPIMDEVQKYEWASKYYFIYDIVDVMTLKSKQYIIPEVWKGLAERVIPDSWDYIPEEVRKMNACKKKNRSEK